MSKYYSHSARAFFDDTLHSTMPDDAVAITDRRHAELLAAQRAGRVIQPGLDGRPLTVPRPTPPIAERRAALVKHAKGEARARILAAVPLWRQANDTALLAEYAAHLAAFGGSELDVTGALDRRAIIDAHRGACDQLETLIAAADAAGLAAIDPADDAHWPAAR